MATIVTFGEIMLRLSPPGRELLFQSPRLRAVFGGAEANVAVSLAVLGHDARYVSVIPANETGEAALRELRKWGVNTAFVLRRGGRLGIYFAERGANQRASKVVYDRDGSAFAEAAAPGAFAWDAVLAGAAWLHVTGITPALSLAAADSILEAVAAARAAGLTISVDLNYRSRLWNYGRKAPEVMKGIVEQAHVLVGNEEDCQRALGIGEPKPAGPGPADLEDFNRLTDLVMAAFPNLSRTAITLRRSFSAHHNGWSAVLRNRGEFITGPDFDIPAVVDRIGTGDAFAAGLIHGLVSGETDAGALAFATAASCLKHSVPGDFNPASESDIRNLIDGDGSGRIRR
jgi:2-dehydro-3-deoxygluconokinase